jgi:hypothetical protein
MPHLELGAATAIMGEEVSDFKSESHFGLTKSQKWLLASLREAIQDDVTHLELLKDMEESWRQARKEAHEVLSTEEDRNLVSLKDELQWFLGGRKGPGLRVRESTGGLNVGGARLMWGRVGQVVWVLSGGCF